MKCVVCNSSDIEMKRIEEEIRSDKDILQHHLIYSFRIDKNIEQYSSACLEIR
jgi:hypothetical protein